MSDLNLFDTYLQSWSAQAAGKPFVTPDLKTCTDPMRFARQLAVVIDVAGLERRD